MLRLKRPGVTQVTGREGAPDERGAVRGRLRGLRRETGGQSMIFVALVLFTLVCFLALTVNVGHRVAAKIEAQGASDAAVLTGATWNARGLNVISVLNVGMTECLALIIMIRAFDKAFKAAQIGWVANYAAAVALSEFGGAVCVAYLEGVKEVMDEFIDPANKEMQKLAEDDSGYLWKAMKVLAESESVVKTGFPLLAFAEASRVARLDGADTMLNVGDWSLPAELTNIADIRAILLPWDGLPVKEGTFQDLCSPTKNGGKGYKNFLCWDSAFEVLGVNTTFTIGLSLLSCPPGVYGLAYNNPLGDLDDVEYSQLCGGGESGVDLEMPTSSCSECTQGKKGTIVWGDESCSTITKSQYDNWGYGTVNNPCKKEARKYYPVTGEYAGCTTPMKTCQYKTDSVSQEDSSSKPKPMVLEGDWADKVTYTAVVRRGVWTRFPWLGFTGDQVKQFEWRRGARTTGFGDGGESLKRLDSEEVKNRGKKDASPDPPANSSAKISLPENMYTFACAGIYNPTEASLFNQDWHARLVPCTAASLDQKLLNILPEEVRSVVDGLLVH